MIFSPRNCGFSRLRNPQTLYSYAGPSLTQASLQQRTAEVLALWTTLHIVTEAKQRLLRASPKPTSAECLMTFATVSISGDFVQLRHCTVNNPQSETLEAALTNMWLISLSTPSLRDSVSSSWPPWFVQLPISSHADFQPTPARLCNHQWDPRRRSHGCSTDVVPAWSVIASMPDYVVVLK